MNQCSQSASLAAYVAATYSDSAVDSVTKPCFFEDHGMAPPFIRKMYTDIVCRCSCEDPSALAYPSRPLSVIPYISFQSFVIEKFVWQHPSERDQDFPWIEQAARLEKRCQGALRQHSNLFNKPIASRYGILHISATSSGVCRHWSLEKRIEGSIGIANGFRSVKLKRVSIESMYNDCDSNIVRASKSLVILIPSSQLTGPRSNNEYLSFNLSL